jgi:monomeric sarcosine oxidase
MSRRYDCIVLGVGGFGSAALYHAAARGLSVLGLEQFSVAHDRGSSHGETRIIRKAYFEHPDYVPLLMRAYELWRRLETEVSHSLLHLCGLMLAGPAEGETIAGARLASRIHGVPLQSVAAAEAERRFSGFRCPETFAVAYEPEAGYLEVERCVRAHVERAIQRGATLSTDEVVEEWRPVGNTVRVRTSKGEYEAAALIVTAGAWTSRILNQLALPLEVVRKPVFWFPARSSVYAVEAGAPTFYFEMPFGHFYGFPSSVRPADWEPLARFVQECLPRLDPTPVRHSMCMYTLTPDRHFIVDRHSEHPQVAFGAGFSGHGFKFTPVIGEALVDLAIEGYSRHPIGFLSAGRGALGKSARSS